MKVLAVSASPRDGGNSDVLCGWFLKGRKMPDMKQKGLVLEQ